MGIRDSIRSWLGLAEHAQPEERLILDGRTGFDGHDYSYGEYQDHNADLATFDDRITQYDQMRVGHASIVSQFEGLLEPILSGTWEVERGPGLPLELGGDEDEKTAERAAELIRANILRDSALTEYRMRTTFKQLVGELFTAQEFGFSIHEKTHRMQDGRAGTFAVYDKLCWIHPRSIKALHVGEDGEFLGITQDIFSSGYYDAETLGWQTRTLTDKQDRNRWGGIFIPAERLVVTTRRKEGDNVEGRPMSRGMYGSYKRLSFFERAQVIDAQKRSIGIPYYRMAKDTPKENLSFAIKQVKGMRNGNERSFVVVQGDDEIGFVDMAANAVPLDGYIRQAGNAIRAVAGTEFKGLGQDAQGGSRALGEVQGQHFNLHIEAIAETIRETIQLRLIEPIHVINFKGITPPVLRVEDVTPPDLNPIVQAQGAQLLGPWRGVDAQSIRKRLKLAELSEEEIETMDEEAEQMRQMRLNGEVDENGNPIMRPGADGEEGEDEDGKEPPSKQRGVTPPKGKKPARKEGGSSKEEPRDSEMAELAEIDPRKVPELGREATAFERRVVRLEDVNAAMHRRETGLTAELRTRRDAMVDEAITKLKFVNGDPEISGRLKQAHVQQTMERAVEQSKQGGAQDMRAEALRQLRALVGDDAELSERVELRDRQSPEVEKFEADLRRAIKAAMDEMDNSVRGAVIGELVLALERGASVEDAVEIARAEVKSRSVTPLARIAGGLTNRAYNLGRLEEAYGVAEEVVEQYEQIDPYNLIRTEILDRITCDPCRLIYDGMVLPLGSDRLNDARPPIGCYGGGRCRGLLLMVMADEASAERVREEVGLPKAREDLRFLRVGQRQGDPPEGRL